MMSSSIESKIQSLQVRLQAENDTRDQVQHEQQPPSFDGLRPGSGRRPNNLGDITQRRQLDLPIGSMRQMNNRVDQETDKKLREIMKRSGLININGQHYQTDIKDLDDLGELGNGTSGHVVKMCHRPSGTIIAVKQMRRTGNDEENKRIIMDLDVVLKSHDCPYIVQCLGCFITDADVWICMELMSTCFDKLQKRSSLPVPEDILGKVTVATVKALSYLKEKHGVIHRDVKPSNILIDERGNIKLCDFGISGRLVDSKANTRSAGCAAYMAPERIDPKKREYDIRADVWSLGITLVELATGSFPYKGCKTDFEVLTKVLESEPPSLPKEEGFSYEFQDFVCKCLTKDHCQRPKYPELLEQPYLKRYESKNVDVPIWFSQVIDKTGIKTHRRISPPKLLQQQLDLLQQQQNLSLKKPNNYQLYNSTKFNGKNGGIYNQQKQQQQHIPLAIISSTNADATTKNNFIEQQQQQNNLNNIISCDKKFLLINSKNINQQQLQLQQQKQFLQQNQQKQLINENLELENYEKIINNNNNNNNKKKIFLDNNKIMEDNYIKTTDQNIITSKIPITTATVMPNGTTTTTSTATTSSLLLNDDIKALKSSFIEVQQQSHQNKQNNDSILPASSPKKDSILHSISHKLMRNLKASPSVQKKKVLNTNIPINNEHDKIVNGNTNNKTNDGFWNITQLPDSGGGFSGNYGYGCNHFLANNNGLLGDCYRSASCSPSPLQRRKILQANMVGNDDNQFINLQGNTSPIVLQRFYHQQNQLSEKNHRQQLRDSIKKNNGTINNSNIPVYRNKKKLSQQMHTNDEQLNNLTEKQLDELNKKLLLLNDEKRRNSTEQNSSTAVNHGKEDQGWFNSFAGAKKRFASYVKLNLTGAASTLTSTLASSNCMQKNKHSLEYLYTNNNRNNQIYSNSNSGISVNATSANTTGVNTTGVNTTSANNTSANTTSANTTSANTTSVIANNAIDNNGIDNIAIDNNGIDNIAIDNITIENNAIASDGNNSNKSITDTESGQINPYFMQEHLLQQHHQQQLFHQNRQHQHMNNEYFYRNYNQTPQHCFLNSYDERHRSPDPPPRYNRGQSPLMLRRNLLEYGQMPNGQMPNGQNYNGSPILPRSYIPSPSPLPPPRRGSESVPGSPQHLRTCINYTPELQRRYYRPDCDYNAIYPTTTVTTVTTTAAPQPQHHKFSLKPKPRDHK